MGQPEEKVVKMHLAPVVRGRRGFPALTLAGKAVRARGARGDGGAGGTRGHGHTPRLWGHSLVLATRGWRGASARAGREGGSGVVAKSKIHSCDKRKAVHAVLQLPEHVPLASRFSTAL